MSRSLQIPATEKNSKARSRKNIFAQKMFRSKLFRREKKSDVTFFENFEFLENIEAPKKSYTFKEVFLVSTAVGRTCWNDSLTASEII